MKLFLLVPIFLLISANSVAESSLIPDVGDIGRLCPNSISCKKVVTFGPDTPHRLSSSSPAPWSLPTFPPFLPFPSAPRMAQHAGSGMGAHNRKRNKSGGSRSAIYSHVKEDSQGGGLTTGRMDPRSSSLPASTHLVCGVSPQVTVWLLELRLAHLHSSQEEGKVRSRKAPAVHPPLGTFPRPHSGTSPGASRAHTCSSNFSSSFLQPVSWGLTKPTPSLA